MSAALSEEEFARRAAALGERASADYPQAWRPDDSEKRHPPLLVGELIRVDDGETTYGPCKIAVLRTPQGAEFAVWLLHSVLKNEFSKLRPRLGELVAVRYEGRIPAEGSRPAYEKYRVIVDRDAGAVDWGFAGDVEPAPTSAPRPDETTGAPAGALCDQCGYTEPEHAAGCPNDDVPF